MILQSVYYLFTIWVGSSNRFGDLPRAGGESRDSYYFLTIWFTIFLLFQSTVSLKNKTYFTIFTISLDFPEGDGAGSTREVHKNSMNLQKLYYLFTILVPHLSSFPGSTKTYGSTNQPNHSTNQKEE